MASLYASDYFVSAYYTLPQYARTADIIGIATFKGSVSSNLVTHSGIPYWDADYLTFEMRQVWLGTIPTNTLTVKFREKDFALPPLDTECVIFVNTHCYDEEIEPYMGVNKPCPSVMITPWTQPKERGLYT